MFVFGQITSDFVYLLLVQQRSLDRLMCSDEEGKAEQQKQVQLPTDARCERSEFER